MCISLLNCNCFGKRSKPVTFHKMPSITMSSPPYSDHVVIDNTSDHEILTIPSIPMETIKRVTNNFGATNVLDGSYGRVYYGALQDRRFPGKTIEVAIKRISQSDDKAQNFHYQISTISKFDHDNIIKIIGYCDLGSLFFLATEFANSRSLYDSLHGQKGVKEAKPKLVLAWKHRVNIAYGVARALQYLHEKEPPISHGNIKSSNVLLFTGNHGVSAKLSDFHPQTNNAVGSMASMLHTNVLGSFGYDSPEVSMTGNSTIKSDTYSYGVILLELLTGQKPIDHSLQKGKQSLVLWCAPILSKRLHECIDPRLEGNYNTKGAIKLASIAEMCLRYEAGSRPKMGDVVRAFRSILI